ncbi:BrnA antitoxin family protein [Methylobacterium sp. J-068]|nr:BrnA antitoxin family protein [Methylobacterium sp. J-068]
MVGATDLPKVDAHEITNEEYEEIPELTDAMVARAIPGDGAEIARRGRGRPKAESPKQQVTMRLDADVLAAMRASGPGWQARANDVLRERFKA